MALNVIFDPAKDYYSGDTYFEFTSFWVAAHNPVVFKVQNTKFPTNSEDSALQVITVQPTAGGLVLITLSGDHKWIKNQYIKLLGFSDESWNGYFSIASTPFTDQVVVNIPYDSSVTFASATVQKAYRNYYQIVRVTAGIPTAHKWNSLKPEEVIGSVKSDPDSANIAVFDVQDYIKQKVSTKNDLTLVSLPNDINLWTGFKVEIAEGYTGFTGLVGLEFDVIEYADNGGYAELRLSGSDFGFEVGDWVELSDFLDDSYNTQWQVIGVVSPDKIVINREYDAYFTLYGSEKAQEYDTSLDAIVSDYQDEGNQWYASNAALPFGNSLGNNLANYMNISGNNDLTPWPTSFERHTLFEGKYIDITAYIDKLLTDSLASDDRLALEIKEYDDTGALIATQYYKMVNQEEGVYRMPYPGIEVAIELVSLNLRYPDNTFSYFEIQKSWVSMSLVTVFNNISIGSLTYKYNTTTDFTTPLFSTTSLSSFNSFMSGKDSGFIQVSTSDIDFEDAGIICSIQYDAPPISSSSITFELPANTADYDFLLYAENFEIDTISSGDAGDTLYYGYRDDPPSGSDYTDFPETLATLNDKLKLSDLGAAHIHVLKASARSTTSRTITITGDYTDESERGIVYLGDTWQNPLSRAALDNNAMVFDGATNYLRVANWTELESDEPFTALVAFYNDASIAGNSGLFTTHLGTAKQSRLNYLSSVGNTLNMSLGTSFNANAINVLTLRSNKGSYQILIYTYSGNQDASGFKSFLNCLSGQSTNSNTYTGGTIINGNSELFVGRNVAGYWKGKMRSLQLLSQDYSNNTELLREAFLKGSFSGLVAGGNFLLDLDFNQSGATKPVDNSGNYVAGDITIFGGLTYNSYF